MNLAKAAEPVARIEPCFLDEAGGELLDLLSDLPAAAATLGAQLHPQTAASLADLVRVMNCYYSNLIEGHNTRPHDIERALRDDLDADEPRRNLQIEARSHIRVQQAVDRDASAGTLPDPASIAFLQHLHREFYRDAPEAMLRIEGAGRSLRMVPGAFRSDPVHDVAVGNHVPPASEFVAAFMAYFAERYAAPRMGTAQRLMGLAAAHHRLNYIHPFPDGNGRVSRLMSHAMAHRAGIGAHGLWSISRGLARGLASRSEYKTMMDLADTPRQGDLDGRGNLSRRALAEFCTWFLRVCLDQVRFMQGLFELEGLGNRLRQYAAAKGWRSEASILLVEVMHRGRIARGDGAIIMQVGERTARTITADLVRDGILASPSPKGALSLRFPVDGRDILFPRLFSEA